MNLKNVLIFGDSYSTFVGYIPNGYAHYYDGVRCDTDVTRLEETWWHQVISETDSTLVLNDSWSGSTIGYIGYNNTDCSKSSSFIYRLEKMAEEGFFKKNKIDTVFVFGGTNDSWCGAPLGEPKTSGFKQSDLYNVIPAIYYFFKSLREKLPETEIYCLINTELKPEITDTLLNASKCFKVNAIKFSHIDKMSGHPTVKGMCDIKEQILNYIKNTCKI